MGFCLVVFLLSYLPNTNVITKYFIYYKTETCLIQYGIASHICHIQLCILQAFTISKQKICFQTEACPHISPSQSFDLELSVPCKTPSQSTMPMDTSKIFLISPSPKPQPLSSEPFTSKYTAMNFFSCAAPNAFARKNNHSLTRLRCHSIKIHRRSPLGEK